MPSRNTFLFIVWSINLSESACLFLSLKQAFLSNEINKAEAAPQLPNTGYVRSSPRREKELVPRHCYCPQWEWYGPPVEICIGLYVWDCLRDNRRVGRKQRKQSCWKGLDATGKQWSAYREVEGKDQFPWFWESLQQPHTKWLWALASTRPSSPFARLPSLGQRHLPHSDTEWKKKKVTENLLFSLIPDGWIFLFSKTVLPKGTWGSCTRQGATACNKNSDLRNSCTFQYLDCIWHFFPEILMHVRSFSVFNSLCLEGQKGDKYT